MFNLLKRAGGARLSAADAVELAKTGDITLVDVRDISELKQTGKAKGAIHIPLAVVRMQGDPRSPDFNKALTTDKPIAVYCASGGRSGMAAQALQSFGFEVHNIGGFGHWQAAGGETEKV